MAIERQIMMAPLQMDLINSFSIDPMLVNKPTMKTVNCNKRFCDSQAKEQPCMNYSELLLQERGIDCLQWEYKILDC
uniref:Uncharacterized protein n=1 Tax=Romanomermis culicivorax TaxID=13658 RepID=A0A915IP74_ROMCU